MAIPPKKEEWSNEVQPAAAAPVPPRAAAPAPQLPPAPPVQPVRVQHVQPEAYMRREPMFEPTAREEWLAKLREEAQKVPPQFFDVSNVNPRRSAVFHDYYGKQVTVQSGTAKYGIPMRPDYAANLGARKLVRYPESGEPDLIVTAAAA